MASNERVVLDSILSDYGSTTKLTGADLIFEVFSFDQILKDFELGQEDLLSGHVDGGNDGGIDGFFTFVDGELLKSDSEANRRKKNQKIDLFIIQSKQTASFSETALATISNTVKDLFDLNKGMDQIGLLYNPQLTDQVGIFRQAYTILASLHASLSIRVAYATKADHVHRKVANNRDNLEETLQKLFPRHQINVELMGVHELVSAFHRIKSYTLSLDFVESMISGNNYVTLASLPAYSRFISDENGALLTHIFDWNVRDYQREVEVNREIASGLRGDGATDFWWLNNGVTILASQATAMGHTLNLDDVQVVNGLQTSTLIHDWYSSEGEHDSDQRSVLVRVIVAQDPETRDRVIRATNMQTSVSAASFRATDDIQRSIEQFLLAHGWYYDRRKNYYKNLGKEPARIVSISFMAQAVMSIVLKQPDTARARPSTVIKKDDDYRRVFNEEIGMEVYLLSARTMKRVDEVLRSDLPKIKAIQPEIRRNFRFHVCTAAIVAKIGSSQYDINGVRAIAADDFSPAEIAASAGRIATVYTNYSSTHPYHVDQIAKSAEFVTFMLKNL